ncbi:ABC transporter ATP-binding protein [Neptunomonas antarctica]|uniref:Sorbitol ABC transporter ATP-binding protein /mannitol ABC transporter ATP-binding protein n=1 Tax=Neptunomonas antarctica TaxID=619304 RepID=A0A1N7L2D2_9GAMM|nr:sn-glycerol-3-phosphate ABC transporter ATP-binding protein UgpC [Neptunomonas antarctica]SIS67947.1 sorbitol ABC transporter ATP-binding protein /mannitol ABC transporter ATP-binding protein [Neptunomonas antarctica]
MADLTITNLRKSYGDVEILKGINLAIKDHEFVVFVGPSGCGKSTLLRSIAGLEEVTSGEIFLDGKEITELAPAKRDLAMVFQSYALYPHMTVRKNMSFALELAGDSKDVINTKVTEAARILELEPLLERKPKDLSGGQRQRVAIGRSIVRNPKVFLFDEPLSNLDAALRIQMRLELARLHHDLNATMIYVTHDQVEAMTLADKVVVLSQGQIEQVGSPMELYHHPVNQFVAGFLGMPKMSFLPGKVVGSDADGVDVELMAGPGVRVPVTSEGVSIGQKVTLGVRPEHIRVTAADESDFHGILDIAEHLGSDTFCYVKTDTKETLTVRTPGDFSGAYGDRIGLSLDLQHCHLFDEQGMAIAKLNRAPEPA